MKLAAGDRVETRDGPGRLVSWEHADRVIYGYGFRRRRVVYALVELDRGGRMLVAAGDVRKAPR